MNVRLPALYPTRTSPHAVEVLLEDGGDPVYRVATRCPARDGQLGGHVFEGYPTEPGAYVLHVGVDDRPRSEWERLDLGEYDASCLGVIVDIGREGSDLVDVLVTTDANGCDDGQSPA